MLIQKLRLQRGWSQQQLADLSGLSVRTIQRIEGGQAASLETLKSLASVFEIDFSTLSQEPDMAASAPTADSIAPPALHPRLPGTTLEEQLAFRHVRRLRGFFMHLAVYLAVIGGLALLNLTGHGHRPWSAWPALGWGIGLLAHAARVFEWLPFMGADWERRQVEKRLGRPL